MTASIIITPGIDLDDGPTFTVHATNYTTGLSVKSCLWRTVEAAEAEARRIELSWRYGVLPNGKGGIA